MTIDLPLVWAVLIATAVLLYVTIDGFDLGVGILFPTIRNEKDRDTAINSIAPVWDGNETWLVLGGGGLFAVFPLAYSVLFTALYAPLIAMLLALVFRGVAFEFRFKDPRHRPYWDIAFAGGSIFATICQGIVLGAFVQGIAVADGRYAGGWFDWLSPFSLFCAVALLAGYALLGATWLVMKTEADLRRRMQSLVLPLTAAVLLAIAGTSLWTPLLNATIADRWFVWPNLLWLSPVPLLVLISGGMIWRAVRRQHDVQPFLFALALFLLSYLGLGISLFPNIVPPDIDIWMAAGPDASLGFLLIGTVVLLPTVLAYTGYVYWIFRGKVRDEGYH
ncbi:MAG: cytochrome d ubiquinol oxidase subunit II [Alphaproteobacteria bacterium]